MKGYPVQGGYIGYADGKWMLFSCERDYVEYLEGESDEG